MTEDYIDCVEVAGKTIQALRVYKDTGEGHQLQIDLTDGTCFNCCFASKSTIEASHIRPGVGEPEVLKSYDLD